MQYAWSAAQYLELIVEGIFGIDYDAKTATVTISPRIPKDMNGEKLELLGLQVADGLFIDTVIDKGRVYCKPSDDSLKIAIEV